MDKYDNISTSYMSSRAEGRAGGLKSRDLCANVHKGPSTAQHAYLRAASLGMTIFSVQYSLSTLTLYSVAAFLNVVCIRFVTYALYKVKLKTL